MLNAWGFATAVAALLAGVGLVRWLILPVSTRYVAVVEDRQAVARAEAESRMDTMRKLEAAAEARQELETRRSSDIPNDIEAWIAEESADWLQSENRELVRTRYAELGDWQKVRRAVGIAEMP